MYITSAAFQSAVSTSHQMVADVQVFDSSTANASYLGTLPIISGTVTIDRTAIIRRQLTLTVPATALNLTNGKTWLPRVPSDYLHPASGTELRVRRGIVLPGGSTEYVPLGYFVIVSVTINDAGNGSVLQINAVDRSHIVSVNTWTDTYTVAAATTLGTALKALLADRAPSLPSLVIDSSLSGTLTGAQAVLGTDGNGDPWNDAVTNLSDNAVAALYFDALGIPKLQPQPSITGTSVATITEGSPGQLLSENRSINSAGIPNQVIVIGQASGSTPVSATATDLDPTSPTHYGGSFGTRTLTQTVQGITDAGAAQIKANALLAAYGGIPEDISLSMIPNPAFDAGDIITVTRPSLGLSHKIILDTLTIGLTDSDPVSAKGRTRQVVTS